MSLSGELNSRDRALLRCLKAKMGTAPELSTTSEKVSQEFPRFTPREVGMRLSIFCRYNPPDLDGLRVEKQKKAERSGTYGAFFNSNIWTVKKVHDY